MSFRITDTAICVTGFISASVLAGFATYRIANFVLDFLDKNSANDANKAKNHTYISIALGTTVGLLVAYSLFDKCLTVIENLHPWAESDRIDLNDPGFFQDPDLIQPF
jgi:hypothetical protein